MLQIILGEVLVEWDELEQATQALTQGVQLLQGYDRDGHARARLWRVGTAASGLAVSENRPRTLHQGEAC